jgi:hypothetical protein
MSSSRSPQYISANIWLLPGDILVVELNLIDTKATLVLGDEKLLDLYGSE